MPKRILDFYLKHLKNSPAYVTINTIAAIAFALIFIWVYAQNTELHRQASTSKVLAIKAQTLAANTRSLTKENAHLLKKIQNNRRDITYKNCREQNNRHKGSLVALRSLLKKSGVSKVRQDAAFAQTKTLVDALVPYRNCIKLANVVIPKERK